MDMWNWLMECYKDGSLSPEQCEMVMRDDKAARELWEDWSRDSSDFIGLVRSEMGPFLQYLKKEKKK